LSRGWWSWLRLGAHHRLDFPQTHHFPGCRAVLPGDLLHRPFRRRLPPDRCICLQLRDVLRLFVRLVTSPRRLGRLSELHGLSGVVQRLLFDESVPHLRSFAGEIKVSAHPLTRDRLVIAESVIVESVSRLLQLSSQAVVCVLKVQHLVLPAILAQACERVMALKHASRGRLLGPVTGERGIEPEEAHVGLNRAGCAQPDGWWESLVWREALTCPVGLPEAR